MHDLISSIAARLERGADRMANAGDAARERLLRSAAEVVRCERDLREALELERLLLQRPAAEAAARIVAFAAAEYASAPADTTSDSIQLQPPPAPMDTRTEFTVDTSDRTANVPVTSDPSKGPPPRPDVPMKTVWGGPFPISWPMQVPETTPEGPEPEHDPPKDQRPPPALEPGAEPDPMQQEPPP